MWFDLGVAVSLVLVLEGLLPTLSPGYFRQLMVSVAQMDDRAIRVSGLISMILGAMLLYWLRH
ncbi:DUF2065 domain-containing protein [Thiohalomonas denitrificans]|uniref:DUF2065 domain-containing protein n=1 Tax=Thiohalomonas denitrificans TaxID=415747 RepID=A0A1G5PL67_9GAMM|nr:DUF2065 domain-containing protein [Thiohalomonas denitrificans]SCZ49809.1 hypothetical protein SAMN03097708_00269 [Thiohalomonas denitrificans]